MIGNIRRLASVRGAIFDQDMHHLDHFLRRDRLDD